MKCNWMKNRKVKSMCTLFTALLCTACGQTEDTTPLLLPPTPTLAATVSPDVSRTPSPTLTPEISVTPTPTLAPTLTLEITETPTLTPTMAPTDTPTPEPTLEVKENEDTVQQDTSWLAEVDLLKEELVWEKRAVLLKEQDVFFACMPEHWRVRTHPDRSTIFIGYPYEEELESIWRKHAGTEVLEELYYKLWIKDYDENERIWTVTEPMGEFEFADGKIGEKGLQKTEWTDLTQEEDEYTELIISEDEKYYLEIYQMSESLYRIFQRMSEEFFDSMMFQTGQLGSTQKKPLCERDKIHVYANGPIRFQAEVPEGILFERKEVDEAGYSLFFYLDDEKTSYVELYYEDENEAIRQDWFYTECFGKKLTDSTYKETAVYDTQKFGHNIYYRYRFWDSWDVFAEVCIPEEKSDLIPVALDIMESVDLY